MTRPSPRLLVVPLALAAWALVLILVGSLHV